MFRRLAACGAVYGAVMMVWFGLDWTQTYVTPGVRRVPQFDPDVWLVRPALILLTVAVMRLMYIVARDIRGPRLHTWGTTRWNKALTDAKLIKNVDAPQARMVGKVRAVDDTTLVTLRLPPGLTVGAVHARLEQVAASLDIPVDRIHVTRNGGKPGLMDVRVTPPPLDLKPRYVDLPDVTSWREPVLLGRDQRGRNLTAPTYNIGQWLVGGITGSGKTTALRLLAAHYALDPSTVVWGCDGKGSRDDWGPIRHRTARWIDVTDTDASSDYLQMLRDVVTLVGERNQAGGRDHPGMLVIFEEATAFRAGLGPAETVEADKLMTRIVQTCRSANVLVVTAAQRPAASLMSTNVRAQAGVALCMRVRSTTDAEMVLGYRPEVPVPEQVGRGLLDVADGAPRTVHVDHLTEAQWVDLCARWAPPPPVLVPDVDDSPQDAPLVDPLLSAVAHALIAAQQPLTAGQLWERLPVEHRTADHRTLGRALTKLGFAATRRYVEGVQRRLYDLDVLTRVMSCGESTSQDEVGVEAL